MTKNLLLILSLLVFSFNANAQDISLTNNVGDTIYYNITSNVLPYTVEVTYKGSSYMAYPNEYMGSIQIPSSITYNGITYSVTSIGEYAFGLCSALSSVNLPNSITSINDQAFFECEALTSINLHDYITSIGDFAFFGCIQLTTVNIPNTLISISHGVFKNTGLTTVNIPNSVRQIGAGAFWNCSQLVSVNIPDSVSSIGSYAFSGCSSLSSPIVLPIVLAKIEDRTFENCSSIPYIQLGKNTNSIGAYAFYNCNSLDTIIFPNNIDTIASNAFGYCLGLNSVTFMGVTPPVFVANNIFMNLPLSMQIHVPCGSKELYESVLMYRNVQDSISCNFLSVNVSNISATHARINVNTSSTDITRIAYQWKENGDTIFNTHIDSYPNLEYTITGLSASTEYNFRIFYVINNDTIYTIIDTFLTRCSTMNLPFNEDFEGVLDCWLGFKSSADSLMIVSTSGAIPNCSPYSGVNMVKYNCWNIQAGNYAGYITPPINLLPNSQLSIWIYRYNGNYSNNNEGLRFYINSEDTLDGANELGFISNNRLAPPIENADGWYNFILSIPNTEVGEKYIFIKAESQYGYDIYFDDLSVYTLSPVTTIDDTICQGETYTLNGFNVDSEGTYIQNISTTSGDSILILNLSMYPIIDTTYITASICQGETYNLNGFNADSTGIYFQNLESINGCDSIIVLNLNVNELMTPTNLSLDNIANYIEIKWQGNQEVYELYRNNDLIANLSDTIYQDTNVVEGTNYCYKIKALNDSCESEFSQEECKVYLEIKNIEGNNLSVSIYPNPTNDKAILTIEGLKKEADIIIYDINGRKLKQYKINSSQKDLEIDVSDFSKGIYNIKILNEDSTISKKLIVQ